MQRFGRIRAQIVEKQFICKLVKLEADSVLFLSDNRQRRKFLSSERSLITLQH